MTDFAAFVGACIASPALLTSACGVLVAPILAWLTVRLITPALARMTDDPGWQAPLAAAAAGIPGALFVVLAVVTLRDGWTSPCLQFAAGRLLYGAVAASTCIALCRAMVSAIRRARDVAALVRRSTPAQAHVAAAGLAAGLPVREIDDRGPVVVLAGCWQPIVLVSTDALKRVNRAELLAAIHHEAAHARRGDLLCAAALTFLADLVPLPVGNLVALYRRAREFAADAHAARFSDPCDLASALLALARRHSADRSLAAFADAGSVRDRLGSLLASAPRRPSRARRALMSIVLATTFLAGAAPALIAAVAGFSCTMSMPA